MKRNDVIVAALSEAGYPPEKTTESYALWRRPLPPLDVVEKARDIAYPGADPERIAADEWASSGRFYVDLMLDQAPQQFTTFRGASLLSGVIRDGR